MRVWLLVRCLGRAMIWGRATKIPRRIARVIVVPTGKLGDVVCCTPVLRALRVNLPQTKIIVAGLSKLHRPLLADSGLVDEYLDFEAPNLESRIQAAQADVAVVTGPSFDSAAPLFLAGVPLVVAARVEGGFSPAQTRPYRIFQKLIRTFPYKINEYAPRERLRSLEPLGIFTDDTRKHLGFSKVTGEKAKQFLAENQIDPQRYFVVGISPSVGNEIKEWPEDRFAQVADHLVARYGAKIIMIGGPKDKDRVRKTISFLKTKTEVTENMDFNIEELKALVSLLHLFIAVDTGPIYIAEAFGVPTIDIVGPVDERVQPPHGFIHRNVIPPNRTRPELSILNARSCDREEALRQVCSTTALSVIQETDGLISDLGRSCKTML